MPKRRKVRKKREEARTSFYLPRELLRAARVYAAQNDVRLREVLIRALRAFLQSQEEAPR